MYVKRGPNEVGNRYERLLVEKYIGTNKHRAALYECLCDCGNRIITKGASLRSGETKSCGCIQKEIAKNTITSYNKSSEYKQPSHKTHGMTRTKIYKIWENMRRRCVDKNHENYKHYGGRGIKVCDEWNKDFCQFYEWAINNGYADGLTIDRINTNGDYEPSNSRWISFKEQCMNKRNTVYVTINGETKTLKQWCEIYKISYKLAHARYRKGWKIEEVLSNKTYRHKNGKTFAYD